MNEWSCRYYIVHILCLCLHLQVMIVTSLPNKINFQGIINNYTHRINTYAIGSSELKYKNGGLQEFEIECSGICQLVSNGNIDSTGSASRNKSEEKINSRTERSVKGKIPSNLNGRQSEQESDLLRVFKYIHYDQFNANSNPVVQKQSKSEEITTTTPQTTTFDRSLIPNSYFSPADSKSKLSNQTSALKPNNSPKESVFSTNGSHLMNSIIQTSTGNADKDGQTVSERPRRSPYRPPSRAALHRLPPRSVLMAIPVPQAVAVPVPVPMPLPYTQNSPTIDFGNYAQYGTNYGNIHQDQDPYLEEQSLNLFSRKKNGHSQPPNSLRRLPPPPRGRRQPPRPRQRPPTRPRPGGGRVGGSHHRQSPSKPQYSYPKDAANIQDILSYFNENDNKISQLNSVMKPPPAPSSGDLSGVSVGGSDFSKELHDVQTSLLKDIREFAQRPSLLGSNSHSPQMSNLGNSPSHYSKQRNKPDSDYTEDSHYDEHKPKPVRDLINKHNQKTRERESEEMNGGHSHYGKTRVRDKYYDSKGSHHSNNRDESRERYNRYQVEKESEETKQNYRDQESEELQREHARRREKERVRSKPKYSDNTRINYKELDENQNSNEDRDRYRHRDRDHDRERDRDKIHSHTNHKRPSNPVVLKRPHGSYKPEDYDSEEVKRKRPQSDHLWHTDDDERRHRGPYANVPRVKPPSITYRPKQSSYLAEAASNRPLSSNSSPEYIEDVVEIHTDSPYRATNTNTREREERERRAHLHRLYLEYLEKKMEAEALSASTTREPMKKQPMRMKIHIYPNENTYQSEQSKNVNYISPPASGFTNHQAISSSPLHDLNQMYSPYKNSNNNQQFSQGQTGVDSTTGFAQTGSGSGPQMMVDKNKNVVLHLHVHRRNGGFGEMEAASEVFASAVTTVKPLTYKEIYDEHQHQKSYQNPEGDNKSVSMELPIRDDKIEDVLHTLLQLRHQ